MKKTWHEEFHDLFRMMFWAETNPSSPTTTTVVVILDSNFSLTSKQHNFKMNTFCARCVFSNLQATTTQVKGWIRNELYLIYIYIHMYNVYIMIYIWCTNTCTWKVVGHLDLSIFYYPFQSGPHETLTQCGTRLPLSKPLLWSKLLRIWMVENILVVSLPFFGPLGYVDVSENSGFSPQIIHFNRVFHYFHHPFWGTHMFGNTHIDASRSQFRVPVDAMILWWQIWWKEFLCHDVSKGLEYQYDLVQQWYCWWQPEIPKNQPPIGMYMKKTL